MQTSFPFLSREIAGWHDRLAPLRTSLTLLPRRRPLAQLVKSIISARTRDAVSQAAFDRMKHRFETPQCLAAAPPAAVERTIADVTFADRKAVQVVAALQTLRGSLHGFHLEALRDLPLDAALAFLETLPGVARKVSASTLNASTLGLPVMIVDTHVLRVLQRLGAVGRSADYRTASEAVTGAMPGWTGADFLALHVEMKRLGQLVCRPEMPLCRACPLAPDCLAAKRSGAQSRSRPPAPM